MEQGAKAQLLQDPLAGEDLHHQADSEAEHGEAAIEELSADVEAPAAVTAGGCDDHPRLDRTRIEKLGAV
ncbi:MAG: hypothetical protein ACRC1L_12635 [Prochlorococcaceae cyanobacterium]